jgi:hypothetical protein
VPHYKSFLLQRPKGSLSGDARDFNNIETRAVIEFFFPARQGAILKEILGEHAPLYATVKNRVAQFKRGDFSPVLRLVPDETKQ